MLTASSAFAACSNPAGTIAEIIYNISTLQFQYCDDTDWIAMHPPGSGGGPLGCPTIGDVCSDGSVYAGLSPDGNVKMYTTPADAPSTLESGSKGADSGTTSLVTGAANTATLAGFGQSAHPAAYYCFDLSAHGHDDWYLPAQDELEVLSANHTAIGDFNTSGSPGIGFYWSSNRNRYGRIVAVCFASGHYVNAWMVRQGWALAYRHYSLDYVADENAARESRAGIWVGAFMPPWDWRARKRLAPSGAGLAAPAVGDRDCSDFATWQEAQAFFGQAGPGDPYRLDADRNGIACEALR